MDVTQATTLLALVSSFDNRKPDPNAAKAWTLALEGVRFDDAQAAIVEHYRTTHRWIMPADVIKGAAKRATLRADELHREELPDALAQMEDGPEFNAAYLEWLRTRELPQHQLTA